MNQHQAYQGGHRDEERIIQAIRDAGFDIQKSSREEDINGVDAWMNGQPVSIKCQRKAQKTGRFSFEMQVKHRNGSLLPGNFASEPPNTLMVLCDGKTIYAGQRRFWTQWVELLPYKHTLGKWEHDGVSGYNTWLNPQTVQSQIDIGHSHIDAFNVCVNMEDMVMQGFIYRVGELRNV